MMSPLKTIWTLVAALALTAPLISAGCSQEEPAEEALGTLSMNLLTTTASGNTYRLRSGIFNVDQGGFEATILSTEDDPNATTLSADLLPGNYSVALEEGWFMEKLGADGTYETVPASLLSAASQDFVIAEGASTAVSYQFKAYGELVTVGGALAISTEVVEEFCADDIAEDNDEEATATSIDLSQEYSATICPFDDDFFVFENPGVLFSVRVEFLQDVGDLDLHVYDADGIRIAVSEGITDNEAADVPVFSTPTGYIRVFGFEDAGAPYTLSASGTPGDWTCEAAWYSDDACDCGCGASDPSCEGADIPAGCEYIACTEEAPYVNPDNSALCTSAPPEWTCPASWYTDPDCDCGCGVIDPACDVPLTIDACVFDDCDGATPNVDPADPTQCIP